MVSNEGAHSAVATVVREGDGVRLRVDAGDCGQGGGEKRSDEAEGGHGEDAVCSLIEEVQPR